jgi:hypothetical protein
LTFWTIPFYFADQSTTNDPVLAEEPCLG